MVPSGVSNPCNSLSNTRYETISYFPKVANLWTLKWFEQRCCLANTH
jgi:hypothetical protein